MPVTPIDPIEFAASKAAALTDARIGTPSVVSIVAAESVELELALEVRVYRALELIAALAVAWLEALEQEESREEREGSLDADADAEALDATLPVKISPSTGM